MLSRIYEEDCAANTDRDFGSDTHYYPALLIAQNASKQPLLFTEDQISVALERAHRNPEDAARASASAHRAERMASVTIFGCLSVAIFAGIMIGYLLGGGP